MITAIIPYGIVRLHRSAFQRGVYNSLYLKCVQIVKLPRKKTCLMASHVSTLTFSVFDFGNAGDTLLSLVLRNLFDVTIGIKNWYNIPLHRIVDDHLVNQINRRNILIIGGGGMFLKDTNPNNLSGWTWLCSIEQLKNIKIPIILFAIGYNRFRGQEDFDAIFTEHINVLFEKAMFIGIRNRGSIDKLKNYLHTDALKNKMKYQPCMTTLINKIYGHRIDFNRKDDFIAVNCAFDRSALRFPSDETLLSIARVTKELSKITKIKYYSHIPVDNSILAYFDRLNIRYELVELKGVQHIVDEYRKPRLVIGMRGHAQMIPFGCLSPILSICSHDKMGWFLDDIHHPEWGVDVREKDFEERLLGKAVQQYENYETCINEIKKAQDELWMITMNNIDCIKNTILHHHNK